MLLTIIAFIIVIGVLVFTHELGHFMVAKAFGVKVTEFSIGFPPRIFSVKKKETKYTIGLLPLGGYVKMLGEEEVSKDKRAFNNQTPGKRLMISVAGVIMNFLLAWIIISIGFSVGMTPLATPSENVPGKVLKQQIFIVDVAKDSAAAKGGLLSGDQIVGLQSGGTLNHDISVSAINDFATANLGKSVTMVVSRDGKDLAKTLTLSSDKSSTVGISYVDQSSKRVTWYMAPVVALRECFMIIKVTFSFLGDMIAKLFTKGQLSDSVGGPIAIYSLSGTAAKAGIITFLQFIATLSLTLSIINIMPFPSLDGGRALFIILETLFKKKIVKEEIENIIHAVGFLLLILLILAITYKDIMRLIHK